MKIAACLLSLSALARAASIPPLTEVLRRTGSAVESFWSEFSSVNCVESVSQSKLGKEGKPVYREESKYDYLIVLQHAAGDISVDESRVTLLEPEKRKNVPLLVTGGFSTLLFVFHPLFQGGFEYSQPELEEEAGRQLFRVRFRQIHGSRSLAVLHLKQREIPIEWTGTAWIDPDSGAVVRIRAELGRSLEDVGLRSLTAEVDYAALTFKDDARPQWLPAEATVEAESAAQHWRNVHRFGDFKRFTVETKTQTQAPK
jgi:hypothetical protein